MELDLLTARQAAAYHRITPARWYQVCEGRLPPTIPKPGARWTREQVESMGKEARRGAFRGSRRDKSARVGKRAARKERAANGE